MAEEGQALRIGAEVRGTIKHLGMYGALVDIGAGQDALLHNSQLARAKSEMAQPGAEVVAYVYRRRRNGYVALSMEKPPIVPWGTIRQGNTYTGQVIRVEDFGVFVDFGAERPGMVHVSELSDNYVRTPSDVAAVGQEVEVRVLKKNGRSRQIDLTMKSAHEELAIEEDEDEEEAPTAMAQAFRRAMQGDSLESGATSQPERARANHRREQEEILARTLRGAQVE